MAGHSPAPVLEVLRAPRGITTMLPTEDAAWVGEELTRRFALAALAVHADRDRRQPDGAADRAHAHRPPARAGLFLLLPRVRGRGVRGGRGRRDGLARGQRGAAGGPRADHDGDRVQRRRRARTGAGDRRDRVRAGRARDDQHGHRAAGRRLPRGAAGAVLALRHAADHRRDAHVLRRSGRVHAGVGPGAGSADDRQGDRRRRAVRRARAVGATSRSGCSPRSRPTTRTRAA